MKLSLQKPVVIDPFKTLIDNLDQNIPQINPPTVTRLINSGSFGKTYLHIDAKTNQKYAVKEINLNKPHLNVEELIQNEVVNYYNISKQCPKYFCQFVGYSYKPNMLTIVMDYCGMDLFDYYTQPSEPSKQKLKKIFTQIAEALQCLHSNSYIHFDLKPKNVTVQDTNNTVIVKLIDAGSLTQLSDYELVRVQGTLDYMAPELQHAFLPKYLDATKKNIPNVFNQMVSGKINNTNLEKTDVYSYGIMVQKMYPDLFDNDFLNELTHPYSFRRPTVEQILDKLNAKKGGKNKTKSKKHKRTTRCRR